MAAKKPTDHSEGLDNCKAQKKSDEAACDKELPPTGDEGKRENGICHGAAEDAFKSCVRKELGAPAALITGAGTAELEAVVLRVPSSR
jgi:hypothetical protein